MKLKHLLTIIGIVLLSIMFTLQLKTCKRNKKAKLTHEIMMLEEVNTMLITFYVPDSLKQASRDASSNLMYAEPDGNDYWSARGKIHETEAYIKTCIPCMYIDSLLQANKQELEDWK